MDSLLASYASSDDEQEESNLQPKQNQPHESTNPTPSKLIGNFFTSLPPPKSSSQSLFSSIPPHKSQTLINPLAPISKSQDRKNQERQAEPKSKPSSLFSLLPQPKTQNSVNSQISLEPKPKKIVQFRPPVNPSLINSKDDEEDSDEEKPKRKSDGLETRTVKSFLSSIPAPKNSGSLGALPSSAGTGRRSILEADVPTVSSSIVNTVNELREDNVGYGGSSNYAVGADPLNSGTESADIVNYDSYRGAEASSLSSGGNNFVTNDNYGGADPSSYPVSEDYANYGSYGDYGQYESRWIDRSGGAVGGEVSGPAVESVGTQISSAAVENVIRIGKRGRNDIPHEVVEVKQDELMKNRPREDQAKSTGIAFGPAYQPVSTKGKPTKLHKRKHQIGSLYFDMRQKEMELAERRSKGFLTKAETQAKYGW